MRLVNVGSTLFDLDEVLYIQGGRDREGKIDGIEVIFKDGKKLIVASHDFREFEKFMETIAAPWQK